MSRAFQKLIIHCYFLGIPETTSILVIVGIIVGCTLAGIFLIIILLIAIRICLKRRKKAAKKKPKRKDGEETESIIDDETDVEPGPSTKLDKIPDVNNVMKKKLPILKMTFKPKLPKIERRAKNKT